MPSRIPGLGLFIVVFITILCSSVQTAAQSDSVALKRPDNYREVMIQAGGVGGYWMFNFEGAIRTDKPVWLYVNSGGSYLRTRDFKGKYNPSGSMSLSFGALIGSPVHKLDLALSNTLFSDVIALETGKSKRTYWLNGAAQVGYRYYHTNSGFFALAYYAGVLVRYEYFVNWGGIGVGYVINWNE